MAKSVSSKSDRVGLPSDPVPWRRAADLTLARAVAGKKIDDAAVSQVAATLATLGSVAPPRGFNVCTYGICVDFFVQPDEMPKLWAGLFETKLAIRRFEGFPWGILVDDLFQVQVEVQVDELAGLVEPGALHGH